MSSPPAPPRPRAARSAQPARLGGFLGIVALVAAGVPLLLFGVAGRERAAIEARRDALVRGMAPVEGDRGGALPPAALPDGATVESLIGPREPAPAGIELPAALFYAPDEVALYRDKSRSEGEFERSLEPPREPRAGFEGDAVVVAWQPPDGFDSLRERLAAAPLLRAGFRLYRWRDGEEPALLATFGGTTTSYEDRDLPLWRERFFYCVATVLEGTLDELPTLIESKRSAVMTAETPERYSLQVLGEEADHVRLELAGEVGGRLLRRALEVAVGDRIAAPADAAGPELDSGLVVTAWRWVEGSLETSRVRPEFLPDGRRKLDPASGLPSFVTEPVTLPTRDLELTCREPSGATRTFTSPSPN